MKILNVNVPGNVPQQKAGTPGTQGANTGGKPPGAPANVGGECKVHLEDNRVAQQVNQAEC